MQETEVSILFELLYWDKNDFQMSRIYDEGSTLLAVPVQQVANMNNLLFTRNGDVVTPCRQVATDAAASNRRTEYVPTALYHMYVTRRLLLTLVSLP
jgi:SUMO ligase MMS21 Smc5/6 complex component